MILTNREGGVRTFSMNIDLTEVEDARIIYAQDNDIVLEKKKDDIQIFSNYITVRFSPEEIASFFTEDFRTYITAQIVVKFSDGRVQVSDRVPTSLCSDDLMGFVLDPFVGYMPKYHAELNTKVDVFLREEERKEVIMQYPVEWLFA